MNWFKIVSLILFTALSSSIFSANITFNAPAYKGETFEFYTIRNFLTNEKLVLGNAVVAEDGGYELRINVDQIIPVYVDFNAYSGWFIAEPSKDYKLHIPAPLQQGYTTPSQRRKVVKLPVITQDKTELNVMVARFDALFNSLFYKNQTDILIKRSVAKADTIIAELKQKFPKTENEYFENHKLYQFGFLHYMAHVKNPYVLIDPYFNFKPVLYHHPSYKKLHDKILHNYLHYSTQLPNGDNLRMMINNGNYKGLIEWLTIDKSMEQQLAETVILTGVQPCLYSKKFNPAGIFEILKQLSATTELRVHKESAQIIIKDFTKKTGVTAPELALNDAEGNVVNWDKFNGRYVYLCFTRSDNIAFQSHRELLQQLWDNYGDHLELVVVLEDEDFEAMSKQLMDVPFKWTILNGKTRKELLDLYKVQIFPSYYLVDPDGKLKLSPAAWPDEDFDQQFNMFLRNSMNNVKNPTEKSHTEAPGIDKID